MISRDFPEVTYQLQRARQNSGWELSSAPAADKPAPAAHERVLAAFPPDATPISTAAILEFFEGTEKPATVRSWLKRAEQAGAVQDAGWGRYRLHVAAP